MRYCHICGSARNIERHHIFGGALRKKSEKFGATVDLCHTCHNEPPQGIHHNAENMLKLKQYGQRKLMIENDWSIEDFRKEFYKNYL